MPTNGQAVKIAHYTRSKFNSLTNKDSATIYYVEEPDGKIKQYVGNTLVVSDITKAEIESKLTGSITSHTHNYRPAGNVPWTEVSGKPTFAPSNAQKNSDITKAEIEAKLTGNITSHTHSQYLTSFTETDPTVPSHVKGITSGNISSWNNKFNTPAGTTSQYVRGNGSLATFPSIPSKVSQLSNDNEYTTKTYVDAGDSVLDGLIDALADYVDNNLLTKVDKVTGKVLSSNDFTTTEKNKLSGIATGAQVNVGTNLSQGARNTTTLRIDSSTGNNLTLPAVTTSLAGLMTSTDKTRLDVLHSLLEEDTANNVVDSISEVLAIFNNYPEGADLVTALAGKVDKVSGKGLSSNDYTTAEKNKLAGIATGAQVNRTIANTTQAQDGTNNTTVMTPARTKEAILKNFTDLGTVTSSDIIAGTGTADRLVSASAIAQGISNAVSTRVPTSRTVNGKALSSNITLTAENVGAAPATHLHTIAQVTDLQAQLNAKSGTGHTHTWAQVTGKPTWIGSSKPTYDAAEVGARSSTWTPTWSQVSSKPTNILRMVSLSGSTLTIEAV